MESSSVGGAKGGASEGVRQRSRRLESMFYCRARCRGCRSTTELCAWLPRGCPEAGGGDNWVCATCAGMNDKAPVRLLVVSGEGKGPYHAEPYRGKLTLRALKARLTRERCGGDRVAWYATPAGRRGEVDGEQMMHPEAALAALERAEVLE